MKDNFNINIKSKDIQNMGGVVKVEIYEVNTKIALYVDTFLLQW